MKSWALDILAYILAWLTLAAVACGDWVEVPCVRQQQGSGILAEMAARLPQAMPGGPIDERGHYGCHYLNAHIRNHLSPWYGFSRGNAGYVYGGMALVLPIPPVRLSEVFQHVPAAYQPWGQAVAEWDGNALYTLDETSAYLATLAASIEGGDTNHPQMRRHVELTAIGCDCLEAIARLSRSRGWRYADELDRYVAWARGYLEQLRGMIR